jgi:hypothetical protein
VFDVQRELAVSTNTSLDMKRLPTLCWIGIFVALTGGCAAHENKSAHISIPSQDKARSDFHHVEIGLCEDYPEESRSLTSARRDFEVLKTNNVRVLRIAFGWDSMEPEHGKYDWSFWDDYVRIATDEFGIRLIPYVCYTPRWASVSTNEDFWQQPPKDTAQFAEFVHVIVARYKNRIHSWEIWNEPDNNYYWRGSVEQFADLLQAGARAVREADPNAKVVMGGLAWNLDFLGAILTNSAAIQNVDVINLHNYYETWATEPLEKICEYTGRASDLLHQYQQRQPIWLAEVGYSSFRRGAYVSGQYLAHYQDEHTPPAQAAALFRALTLACASGKVALTAWYRINDLPETQQVIGDANNRHLGILDERGRPKPALAALRFFTQLFADGFRCVDGQVRVTRKIHSPVEVHSFKTAHYELVIVAWLRTYIPGSRDDDLSGNIPDKREETISISIPFATNGDAKFFDEFGNDLGIRDRKNSQLKNLRVRDGNIKIVKIPCGVR